MSKFNSRYPGIELHRLGKKESAQGLCLVCEPEDASEDDLLLDLSLGQTSFFLCEKHEMQLISTLLANYVRKIQRGKRMPVIFKQVDEEEEKEPEACQAVVVWNEQKHTFEKEEACD